MAQDTVRKLAQASIRACQINNSNGLCIYIRYSVRVSRRGLDIKTSYTKSLTLLQKNKVSHATAFVSATKAIEPDQKSKIPSSKAPAPASMIFASVQKNKVSEVNAFELW
ncbi:MAG TPA: hypothetical protein VFI29_11070 [Hanamia sp.]|nr:hypothetical protein [Hanamia sp.]